MALRTFQIARRAYDAALRRNAERDPLVISVLNRFPGSEIVAIVEVPECATGAPVPASFAPSIPSISGGCDPLERMDH